MGTVALLITILSTLYNFKYPHKFLLGKNRHRENKGTQSTTQEYNMETPKQEKKPRPLSKPIARE
jgi:hypothetical protein